MVRSLIKHVSTVQIFHLQALRPTSVFPDLWSLRFFGNTEKYTLISWPQLIRHGWVTAQGFQMNCALTLVWGPFLAKQNLAISNVRVISNQAV